MDKLSPDKEVNNGQVSDVAMHLPILDNEEASNQADDYAMKVAVELGFTPEEAMEMCGGAMDVVEDIKGMATSRPLRPGEALKS